LKLKLVKRPHVVCSGNDPDNLDEVGPHRSLPGSARYFWKRAGLFSCDSAVIAMEGEQLVGFFRYWVEKPMLQAAGTWVHPDYRGRGIAKKMWVKVLSQSWVKTVRFGTVSDGGRGMMKAVKTHFKPRRLRFKGS
jgi:GNAT superfamily N-acetyltransferase